jgi:hypothetical protein
LELRNWEIAITSRLAGPNPTFPNHSVLKLFTGFAIAAFIAWKLIVINAINSAVNAAIANTHQRKLVL